MKKLLKKILLAVFFISTNIAILPKNSNYSIEFHTSVLSGKANEIVYRTNGSKLSELIWGLDDIKLIGLGAQYYFAENFAFNGDFFINYQDGESTIDDYDWLYEGTDWTHWSNSPTKITDVLKYDFNFTLDLLPLGQGTLYFAFGYKEDTYNWDAYGGTYIYSDTDNGQFRDETGTFPNTLLLSYKQNFKTPYIGIGIKYEEDLFTADALLKYSNKVEAYDEDNHYARNLYFEEYFENGEFISLSLRGEIKINYNIFINAFYQFEKHMLNKGWTQTTDTSTGNVSISGYESAGIKNEISNIGIGIKYIY